MKYKRLVIILAAIAFLLLLPLTAMQFTDEVNWKTIDFVVVGILLLVAGISCELVLRKIKKRSYKIIICAVVLLLILLIWAELAVGILGTLFAGS